MLTQADHILMKPTLWMGKLRLRIGHKQEDKTSRSQLSSKPVLLPWVVPLVLPTLILWPHLSWAYDRVLAESKPCR